VKISWGTLTIELLLSVGKREPSVKHSPNRVDIASKSSQMHVDRRCISEAARTRVQLT